MKEFIRDTLWFLFRLIPCILTFGHWMVWDSEDPDEEKMHCRKCGFKWSVWDNVGAV